MSAAGLDATAVSVTLAGRRVLAGVSLAVPRGTATVLLAPSGAGKSTLLRCLVRLVEPEAGRIALDGADVRDLDPRELRRRVGLVAQAPAMLPGTVADNLRYRAPGADVPGALAAAGLNASFADRPAAELSGGERSRVALARALSRDPEILLLDEPTAALDAAAAAHVAATVRDLTATAGLGICVVTHDPVFAEAVGGRQVALG